MQEDKSKIGDMSHLGSKPAYPRPLPDTFLLSREEMESMPLEAAQDEWQRRYRQRMIRNPLWVLTYVVLLAALISQFAKGSLYEASNKIYYLLIGAFFVLMLLASWFDTKYTHNTPKFWAMRSQIPPEIIAKVGEPSYKDVQALAMVIRPSNRRYALFHCFESGEFENWVQEFGLGGASEMYWRTARKLAWQFSREEFWDYIRRRQRPERRP